MRCKHWDKIPEDFASEPECAFDENGEFVPDNWNCHLMNELRLAKNIVEIWSEDDNIGVIPNPDSPGFVILAYYKHRGRTDAFYIIEDGKIRYGTEKDALEWAEKVRK